MMRPACLERGAYFGTALRRVDVGPFQFTDTVYAQGERLRNHQHDDPTVFVVRSGIVVEESAFGVVHHPAFTAVFNPGGFEHQTAFQGPTPRVLNIQFDPRWLEAVRQPTVRTVVSQAFAAAAVARLFAAIVAGDACTGVLEGLIGDLILQPGFSRGDRPLARRAARMIKERPDTRNRLGRLALELNVERTQLAHSFRREFGVSMQEFAARLRFTEACEQLAAGARSLTGVAYGVGYSDQSHMSRDIRRRTGLSPTQLRVILQFDCSGVTYVQDR